MNLKTRIIDKISTGPEPCAGKPAGVMRFLGRACQSLLYKYSHHGRFQAAKVRSLNVELGRNEHVPPSRPIGVAPGHHRFHTGGFQSVATW